MTHLIISATTLIAVFVTWWFNRRRMKRLSKEVAEVHKMVNSRMDRAEGIIDDLKKEIKRLNEQSVVTPKRVSTGVVLIDGEVSTPTERGTKP